MTTAFPVSLLPLAEASNVCRPAGVAVAVGDGSAIVVICNCIVADVVGVAFADDVPPDFGVELERARGEVLEEFFGPGRRSVSKVSTTITNKPIRSHFLFPEVNEESIFFIP